MMITVLRPLALVGLIITALVNPPGTGAVAAELDLPALGDRALKLSRDIEAGTLYWTDAALASLEHEANRQQGPAVLTSWLRLTHYYFFRNRKAEARRFLQNLQREAQQQNNAEFKRIAALFDARIAALDADRDHRWVPADIDEPDSGEDFWRYHTLKAEFDAYGIIWSRQSWANDSSLLSVLDALSVIPDQPDAAYYKIWLHTALTIVFALLHDIEGQIDHFEAALAIAAANDLRFDSEQLLTVLGLRLQTAEIGDHGVGVLKTLATMARVDGDAAAARLADMGMARSLHSLGRYSESSAIAQSVLRTNSGNGLGHNWMLTLLLIESANQAHLGNVSAARDLVKRYDRLIKADGIDGGGNHHVFNSYYALALAEGRFSDALRNQRERYQLQLQQRIGQAVYLGRELRSSLQDSIIQKEMLLDVREKQAKLIASERRRDGVIRLLLILMCITLGIAVVIQRRSQANIRRYAVAAESANNAKTLFLANMSHELRTPLNAIIGFAELIRRESFGPLANKKYRRYIVDILVASHGLKSLIDDILDLSRIEAGKFELSEEFFDIADIRHHVDAVIEGGFGREAKRLCWHIGSPSAAFYADRQAVQQILLNIVSNALKFSEGRVDIFVECCGDNGSAVIKVQDQGIGISADDMARVLQPFEQLESVLSRTHRGVGLGLPLVNQLMHLHGGTLSIQSEPGEGTVVTLEFPGQRPTEHHSAGMATSRHDEAESI